MEQNYASHCNTFADYMIKSLRLSSPMPGTTPQHQIAAFNRQFMRIQCDFIVHHVLGDDAVPAFTVTDGAPTSRFGADHYRQDANCILATWNTVVSHNPQLRSDRQATAGSLQSGGYNAYNGAGDGHMVSGITFCDQSGLNTSSHVSALLDDPTTVALNRTTDWTNTAFGNATPASDARLLSRRIFRRNEDGVENGVRMGEVRLQRRNLDRDIDETLHADGEMSGMSRGYDMSSLNCRVDRKQQWRNFYAPNAPPQESLLRIT